MHPVFTLENDLEDGVRSTFILRSSDFYAGLFRGGTIYNECALDVKDDGHSRLFSRKEHVAPDIIRMHWADIFALKVPNQ